MGSRKSGLQLSATQLAASVLAAVTATVAGSFLGVNGTIIGAAVASVVTVVGNAVYSHSIHRTRERVRTVPAMRRVAPPAVAPVAAPTRPLPRVDELPPPVRPRLSPGTAVWRRAGLAAAGVFVALLAVLTSVELVSGRPLSDLLHGTAASGTSVFGSSQQPARNQPAPARVTVTQTVVPKVITTTPTITQTAPPVTVTPTPTPTSTSGQGGDTGVPTPSATASATSP